MTLSEYVLKRNGVPLGASNSLKKMLYRSFGANNFAAFWNYWNPIWGYYLAYYSFKPLKQFFPSWLSVILTFLICGIIHDIAISVISGSISITFTIWFLIISVAVVLTQLLRLDFNRFNWYFRAFINLLYLVATFVLTKYIKFVILS